MNADNKMTWANLRRRGADSLHSPNGLLRKLSALICVHLRLEQFYAAPHSVSSVITFVCVALTSVALVSVMAATRKPLKLSPACTVLPLMMAEECPGAKKMACSFNSSAGALATGVGAGAGFSATATGAAGVGAGAVTC